MRRISALLVLLCGLLVSAAGSEAAVGGEGNRITADETKDGRSAEAEAPLPPAPIAGERVVANRSKLLKRKRSTPRHVAPPPPRPPCREGGGGYWDGDPHQPLSEYVTFPDCPDPVTGTRRPPGSAGPAAPPTAAEVAAQIWYWETLLPDPGLATSPPNGAITGLDLYLSIGGPQHLTFDVAALGYDVRIEATSVYDVDWGDPRPDSSPHGEAVTEDHPNQGGPYPTGDLRHQYIDRGEVTITVTQKWTAQWTAGGESGTIEDRLVTSASRTIPVQEIQAIVTG